MATKKHPIVIATWDRQGARHWGDSVSSNLDTCASTTLSFRTAKPRNDWHNDYDNAICDISANIWFDAEKINIDLRVHNVYHKSERDLEYLLKVLKSLRRKSAKSFLIDQFVGGEPIITLIQFFQSVGIKKTVKYPDGYSSAEYEYGDVFELCEKLAKHIAYIRTTFKKREAA